MATFFKLLTILINGAILTGAIAFGILAHERGSFLLWGIAFAMAIFYTLSSYPTLWYRRA
jgi:hypothetical protein